MSALFSDLLGVLPSDPELSEGEREMLRQLSAPGGPLWKIVKSALDYADHMKDHIVAVELVEPEQIGMARQLQLKRTAALDFLKWFVQCYASTPQSGQARRNDFNG